MTAITSTDLGAAGRFIALAANANLNNMGSQTFMVYYRPTAGGSENGTGYFVGKTPSASTAGPRFFTGHNTNAPNLGVGFQSSDGGNPNRTSGNSMVTYGSWQHSAAVWTGAQTGASLTLYKGVGATIAEVGSYSTTNNSAGSISDDSANVEYLMNRLGLDRALVADVAYIARWNRNLTLAELVEAQTNGPLRIGGVVYCYANGAIFDPQGFGIAIGSRSTRVTGAVPVANLELGDDIVISDNFERSSIRTEFSRVIGLGDSAVIEMYPRSFTAEIVSNETRWQVPVAKVTGVNGIRPTFRWLNYGAGDTQFWDHPYPAGQACAFRYETGAWQNIDTAVTLNAGDITFRHSTAFTENVVYLSTQRISTNTDLATFITTLAAAHPTKVKNVRSNLPGEGFVSGHFSATADQYGRVIPSQPFYGLKISDDALGSAPKRRWVVTTGTHAGEDIARIYAMAAIEYLCGASAEAVNVRTNFEVYFYGNVNAPGIYAGAFRSGIVTEGDGGNDPNRNFTHAAASTLEVVTLPRGVIETDLPLGIQIHLGTDLHMNWDLIYFTAYDSSDPPYEDLLVPRLDVAMGAFTVTDLGDLAGDDQGGTSVGGYWHERGTYFCLTPEISIYTAVTDDFIASFGRGLVQMVSDSLDNAEFPAGEFDPAGVAKHASALVSVGTLMTR